MTSRATFPLPTDTAHVAIESRQYRLFRFDLGEGVVRAKMLVGALIVGSWFTVLGILGVSFLDHSPFYLVPSVLLSWAAVRTDDGGRPAYALWLDRGRFWLRRRRPMIDAPEHPGVPARPYVTRAEWVVLDLADTARAGRTE